MPLIVGIDFASLLASGVVEALDYACLNDFCLLDHSICSYAAGAVVALVGRNEGGKTLSRSTITAVMDTAFTFFDPSHPAVVLSCAKVVTPLRRVATMAVADGEQWCPDWAKPPLPKASGGPPPPLVTAQPQPALDWGAWPTAAADGDDLFAPPKAAAEGEAEVASFPLTDPHACVAFGCKAIKLISRCQEALELAPDATHGPHGKLLGEIHELKKKFYGPAMMRAAARHRRFSLASASKRVLKAWFDEHLDSPYPTPKEKSLLARSAGLSIKQVNDWFTNYRKRHWEQELVKAQALDFDDHSASSGSS